MTPLVAALAGNHPDTVTWVGYEHNLLWVRFGNLIGGGSFIGRAFGLVTRGTEHMDGALSKAPCNSADAWRW